MPGPVKIGDVAAAAGVSTTTVSHALNNKGRLTDETRRRVREVADRLGYKPSPLARGLARGRTGLLALTVSSVDQVTLTIGDYDYFVQLMNAATSAAFDHGFSLILVSEASRQEVLGQLPLDGVIVIDPMPDDETVDLLADRRVPVVTTGRVPEGPPDACWVDNDHVAGARAVVEHLAQAGATHLALLTPPTFQSYARDSLQGFERACEELGLTSVVETVTESLSESGAFAAASRLLESRRPPDAIYATLDRLALGALLAAEAKRVLVPDELLVAGCTDSRAARSSRPSLTALSLNPEQIATQALDLLITLVELGAPREPHRIVPFDLIPRASTRSSLSAGSPPTNDATG